MPASHHRGLVAVGLGHPKVEQYRNIKHNRRPYPRHAIAFEGLWALRAAIIAGVPVDAAFVCPSLLRGGDALELLQALRAAGTGTYEVSERVFRRMAERDGPDGIAGVARLPDVALVDVPIRPSTRIVVADRFELAGNLGTIVRTADGAGASAVVVTDLRVRLSHPLVLKASMGTIFSLPVVAASRDETSSWLRRGGFTVVAADPAADVSYRDIGYEGPIAIVLGSERYGLDPSWRARADRVVSIPMLGTADSLNVGHAAALLLYEALHRAGGPTPPADEP